MSMLSGVYRADAGEILIHGKPARIRSPKDAALLGVGMVFQNFRLVQSLTAAENIVLGEKSSFWRGSRWIKRKHEEIEVLGERFGLKFPVGRPIWQLSVGEQQRVEIVKTLYRGQTSSFWMSRLRCSRRGGGAAVRDPSGDEAGGQDSDHDHA